MSKFSFNRRLLLMVGSGIPVAIFFAARSAASWRPQLVGNQGATIGLSSSYLRLSPDEKWLVSEGENLNGGEHRNHCFLWDLSGAGQMRVLKGTGAVFSSDSQLIASIDDPSQDIILNDLARQKWKAHPTKFPLEANLRFVLNNTALQYEDWHFDPLKSAIQLDVKNGRALGKKKLPPSLWRDEGKHKDKKGMLIRSRISFFPPGAENPQFFFDLKAEDIWKLAPDGLHLWVSDYAKSRFDILDARTGQKVWFYGSTDVDLFNCYPKWENGGKALAAIQNDTLIVRDSASGKIVLSHKNNLPTPLKSWAFTKDGGTVYLMDAKGEIFRQRLR